MARHYMQYWIPREVAREFARESREKRPLTVAAGEQLKKMSHADTIWIVGVNDYGHLTLHGRLVVDDVLTDEAALVQRVGRAPSYKADYYAVAVPATEEFFKDIDISPIASALRFIGKPDSLTVVDHKVNPQQLQAVRLVSEESVALLQQAWYDTGIATETRDAGPHVEPKTDLERWGDELVEYFNELGGTARLQDLYEYIEAHPKRELKEGWQDVVRFRIYEHSSDSDIAVGAICLSELVINAAAFGPSGSSENLPSSAIQRVLRKTFRPVYRRKNANTLERCSSVTSA